MQRLSRFLLSDTLPGKRLRTTFLVFATIVILSASPGFVSAGQQGSYVPPQNGGLVTKAKSLPPAFQSAPTNATNPADRQSTLQPSPTASRLLDSPRQEPSTIPVVPQEFIGNHQRQFSSEKKAVSPPPSRGPLPPLRSSAEPPIRDRNLQPATFNSPVTFNSTNNGGLPPGQVGQNLGGQGPANPVGTNRFSTAGNGGQPTAPPAGRSNTPSGNRLSPNTQMAQNLLSELAGARQVVNTNGPKGIKGQPMPLLDMLANCDSHRRKGLIKQYWATYQAWANYRFAIEEMQWLQQANQVRSNVERSILEAAKSAASDSMAARAMDLNEQQQRLDQFLNGPRSNPLPLPSDMPLVKGYRTNFDLYAAKQSMSDELRMIDSWLPEQQLLIGDRAATVQRCRNATLQARNAMGQAGNGESIPNLLQAIEMTRTCHARFIESVVDYNQRIAEYALTLKPNHSAERVVAMLIPARTPNPQQGNPFTNQTRQATLQGTPYQPSAVNPNNGFRMNEGARQSALPVRNPQPNQPSTNANSAIQPAAAAPTLGGGSNRSGLPGQSRFSGDSSSPAATPPPAFDPAKRAFGGGTNRPPLPPSSNLGTGGFRR